MGLTPVAARMISQKVKRRPPAWSHTKAFMGRVCGLLRAAAAHIARLVHEAVSKRLAARTALPSHPHGPSVAPPTPPIDNQMSLLPIIALLSVLIVFVMAAAILICMSAPPLKSLLRGALRSGLEWLEEPEHENHMPDRGRLSWTGAGWEQTPRGSPGSTASSPHSVSAVDLDRHALNIQKRARGVSDPPSEHATSSLAEVLPPVTGRPIAHADGAARAQPTGRRSHCGRVESLLPQAPRGPSHVARGEAEALGQSLLHVARWDWLILFQNARAAARWWAQRVPLLTCVSPHGLTDRPHETLSHNTRGPHAQLHIFICRRQPSEPRCQRTERQRRGQGSSQTASHVTDTVVSVHTAHS